MGAPEGGQNIKKIVSGSLCEVDLDKGLFGLKRISVVVQYVVLYYDKGFFTLCECLDVDFLASHQDPLAIFDMTI